MTRRRLLALTGLLLAAGLAALAVLPARWLMAILPPHWPLAIVDASGTVWAGRAALAIGPEQSRRRLPDPLHWRWSFARGPKMELHHPWLNGPLILALSPTGLIVSSQTLALTAQALATLDARIAAIDPGGRLSVTWPATRISWKAQQNGTRILDAEWRDAASALTPIRPLGHYTLSLTHATGGGADLALASRHGPLLLEGSGSLDTRQGLRFKGTARADPTVDPTIHAALRDVLSALGPRHNDLTLLHYR